MTKAPIGLQLFSVRGEVQKDLPAALKGVAGLGYKGAEPWGYSGEELAWMGYGAKELRQLYDDSGLVCCGMHVGTGALMGDNLKRTIELNQVLGNQFMIIAADKQRMNGGLETIMELAGILNSAAEVLKPLGLYCGYHAHPFDFVKLGGETAWEILFGNTVQDVVMQMDNGNCANGDGDPAAMLRKFPGRALTMHIKDYGGEPDSVIGEGKTDWVELFDLCDNLHHTQWYVVEEGSKDGFGFEISGRSLAALKAMGRA